jgi:zinc transport system substrate-binding protein
MKNRLRNGHATPPPSLILLVLFCLGVYAPHGVAAKDRAAGKPLACFVSILPQAFFVEKIASEYVDVHVMVGPGQSPHTYEPTSRQLSELARSQVYFAIGVAFEGSLLPRIERSFKEVRIVDTSKGIALRPMVDHHDDSPKAGSAGSSHLHAESALHGGRTGAFDPHVWVSPRLAVAIAGNIRDALVKLDPQHSSTYAENLQRLEAELSAVDGEIARLLAPYAGREFFVFHPAYGYFADAYGLTQVAIEEQGGAPGPKHLAQLIDRAKRQGARAIFVQPQVSATYAETVAKALGGQVVLLDPLARDYPENLLYMARKIVTSFEAR